MVTRAIFVFVFGVVCAACQGQEAAPRVEVGSAGVTRAIDARLLESDAAAGSTAVVEEPVAIDAGIPTWQAVVDRRLYLARRGQHGVVVGTVGGPVADSPYTWLVDDTEGNGALAIRVSGPFGKGPQRVALGGAWALDDQHRWFWTVDSVDVLAPAPASELKEPPVVTGHLIASGELPAGSRPISLAKDNEAVYFTLVGPPPTVDGDGWPVADELGNPVYALLNLPGERASYGAQDLRSPDERWQLKRGQTYALRIGYVHKHGDKPATINARTAPVRVK